MEIVEPSGEHSPVRVGPRSPGHVLKRGIILFLDLVDVTDSVSHFLAAVLAPGGSLEHVAFEGIRSHFAVVPVHVGGIVFVPEKIQIIFSDEFHPPINLAQYRVPFLTRREEVCALPAFRRIEGLGGGKHGAQSEVVEEITRFVDQIPSEGPRFFFGAGGIIFQTVIRAQMEVEPGIPEEGVRVLQLFFQPGEQPRPPYFFLEAPLHGGDDFLHGRRGRFLLRDRFLGQNWGCPAEQDHKEAYPQDGKEHPHPWRASSAGQWRYTLPPQQNPFLT